MKSDIYSKFKALGEQATNDCDHGQGTRDFEASFIAVLKFLSDGRNDSIRDLVVRDFIDSLSGKPSLPWELISFCMHRLRWMEVYDAAGELLQKASDFRVKSVMAHIRAAYSDDWYEAQMYAHFS
jgi:hypothetical protein